MTTIVNTPPATNNDSGGMMGMVFGLIVLVILGYLFVFYGVPAIRQFQSRGIQINVPSDINVNVNKTE